VFLWAICHRCLINNHSAVSPMASSLAYTKVVCIMSIFCTSPSNRQERIYTYTIYKLLMTLKRTVKLKQQLKNPLDEQIIEYLLRHKGCAEWGELRKEARPNNTIADPVLKAAIDRLMKSKQLIADAKIIEGKAHTIYCLERRSRQLPSMKIDCRSISLNEWIEYQLSEIEKAHAKYEAYKINEFNAGRQPIRYGDSSVKAGILVGPEAKKIQRDAIVQLIKLLTDQLINIFDYYSAQKNDDTAEEFIDPMIKKYLSTLIKMSAKIASPRYGYLEVKEIKKELK